jgi:hypothetical protein
MKNLMNVFMTLMFLALSLGTTAALAAVPSGDPATMLGDATPNPDNADANTPGFCKHCHDQTFGVNTSDTNDCAAKGASCTFPAGGAAPAIRLPTTTTDQIH